MSAEDWYRSDVLDIVALTEAVARDDPAAHRWAIEECEVLLRHADLRLLACRLANIFATEHGDDLEWWALLWRLRAAHVGERPDER